MFSIAGLTFENRQMFYNGILITRLQASYTSSTSRRGTNLFTGIHDDILKRVVEEEQSPAAHGPHVIVASEPTSELFLHPIV